MLKKTSISRFIFSCLLFVISASLFAQQSNDTTAVDQYGILKVENSASQTAATSLDLEQLKKRVPIYQGTYINLDIFNPIASAWNDGRFEFEVSVDVSLWQRFFPVIEAGGMFLNQQTDSYQYISNGMFVRTGFNYNFLNTKIDRKYDHILYVGARYAYTYTDYQILNAKIENDYFKEEGVYSTDKQAASVGYLEVVAGVRVQIYKNFFMGLSLKINTLAHGYGQEMLYPAFIPGFGRYKVDTTNFGLTYTLTYQIPYKK